MSSFKMRALEIHSEHAWNFSWVKRGLAFAKTHDLNALILHRNDIVDRVVYPATYFGASRNGYRNVHERYHDIFRSLYRYTPTRRSGPIVRRDFLKRVAEEASRSGITLYLENKELSFPDILLELHPELTKEGHLCPNEPFWWEFIDEKYRELFVDVPGIGGIITSPGTGESRIAISANRCRCDLCRAKTPAQWYRDLVMAMYRPIKDAGKLLAVRDFVFDSATHRNLAQAFAELPEDIIAAIKNTPHDYYPTFPNNPLLGNAGGRVQWVEFDTMAQYYGWGIAPATMVDDTRSRLRYAEEQGATGVMLRTDWENLEGHTSFDTLNLVNLYAGAALAKDVRSPSEDIYARWLSEQGAFNPAASETERDGAVAWVRSIFDRNWGIVRNALFINDCVFSDSSMFPVGIDHALWLAEEKNSLKDWVPEKASALSTDEKNVRAILESREQALAEVTVLRAEVEKGCPGLAETFLDLLKTRYEIFQLYVKGYAAIGRSFILARYLQEKRSGRTAKSGGSLLHIGPAAGNGSSFEEDATKQLLAEIARIDAIVEEYRLFYDTTEHEHAAYMLLSPERLLSFRDDVLVEVGETIGVPRAAEGGVH